MHTDDTPDLSWIKLGFTGTQRGLTDAQRAAFRTVVLNLLVRYRIEAHHGDCIGADVEFHSVLRELGVAPPTGLIIGHPPVDSRRRALCDFDEVRRSQSFLLRNHDIVEEATDGLIACPGEMNEQLRSGTWATVRYARKIKRPVRIIYPDGVRAL